MEKTPVLFPKPEGYEPGHPDFYTHTIGTASQGTLFGWLCVQVHSLKRWQKNEAAEVEEGNWNPIPGIRAFLYDFEQALLGRMNRETYIVNLGSRISLEGLSVYEDSTST